jgi:hypothetical protein
MSDQSGSEGISLGLNYSQMRKVKIHANLASGCSVLCMLA